MEGGRPSREPADAESNPNDEFTSGALERLSRFGGSELGCLCSLAVAARSLCGGSPVRIELRGDPAAGDGGQALGFPSPDHHRLPVGGPCDAGPVDAWLVLEAGEAAVPAPDLEALGRLAACAGLMLERHRLAGYARRARQELVEARSTLAHGLRGLLHSVLIRTDTLLLGLRQGKKSPKEIDAGLQRLKEALLDMTERIRQLLERPDFGVAARARATRETGRQVRVPELLRELAESASEWEEREGRPNVAVEGDVAALRADRRRLASGLADLFDLARRSPVAPTFTVRPDPASSGVRIQLPLEPPARDAANGPWGAAQPAPGSAATDAEEDGPGLSLRELLDEIGGRLRIEAGAGTEVDVVLILPAA